MPATFARPLKVPELIGIRGIAALWVFGFHVWLVAGSPTLTVYGIDLSPLLSYGWAGLDVFFVLSGFALTWFQRDQDLVAFRYEEFMRRRALRIVPAYYAQFIVLLLLAAAGIAGELPSFGTTISHLLFIHSFDLQWFSQLSHTWSTLSVGWQLYLVFPLVLAALSRYGAPRVLILLIVATLVWHVGVHQWILTYKPAASVEYRAWLIEQLPGRIYQFSVGLAAARLTRTLSARLNEVQCSRLSAALLLSGAVVTMALMVLMSSLGVGLLRGHWLLYMWHLLAALSMAALIAGVALNGSLAKVVLGNGPTVWLGEISYSICLWNYLVLLGMERLGLFDSLVGFDRILWVAIYSAPPVLLVAAASWWFVERPFLHYRDVQVRYATGSHLAAVIRSPWGFVVAAAALILAVLVAAQLYWRPNAETRVQCGERGSVDGPALVRGSQDLVHVVGWVHDYSRSDRIRRVVVRQGDAVIGETVPALERPDVSAALPHCRVGKPGFGVLLRVADLALGPGPLIVEAERASGRRFRLGELDWRFGPPRAGIDLSEPLSPNGENVLLGWAWHPAGPVQVRWRLGEQIIATTMASNAREDVGQAFPRWPNVAQSGFRFRVKFGDLPRESGMSVLEFVSQDGQRTELPGPRITNDAPIGIVSTNGPSHILEPKRVAISAWLYDEDDIAEATVATELGVPLGKLLRAQVAVPLPGLLTDPRKIPSSEFWNRALRQGSVFNGSIPARLIPVGLQRLVVHVRDRRGRESVLPGPLVIRKLPLVSAACPGEPFTVYLWATTTMLRGGLRELADFRRIAEGGCVRFGIHTRVEYLRTTKGKAADFAFDPDFPDTLRLQQGKEMTTTSLREALAMADRYRVPMRILLDGGVWADSHFAIPDYDITDWLEEDDRLVQWNQFGRAEADDALQGLAGSHDNPQLARVMTLNVYAEAYRYYKRRNLQSAIRLIAEHNQRHPERPVSVTFDPDLYINPWFYLKQWYDYNPDTLRQFREWLTHTGPYAAGGNLAGLGRRERLNLEDINRIAGTHWSSLQDVDPPRSNPNYSSPWHQIWTVFKRHLVARHYADLARWARDAGLAPEHIFTAQTFIQADVSITGDDPATGWTDEAGVSIAGAKPADGHMGVILYGPASRNQGKPRSGPSLFANIRTIDQDWQVAEMNPADIEQPDHIPDHDEAYRTISAIFNFGAGAISPMWTGKASEKSVRPNQFRSYDTMLGSPFETQLLLYLREIADVPRGSQVWTFGNAHVISDDGFVAFPNSELHLEGGSISVKARDGSSKSGAVGLFRNMDGWTIPRNACMLIESRGASQGIVRLRSSSGKGLDTDWLSDSGSASVSLAGFSGEQLQRLELLTGGEPTTLTRVRLQSCPNDGRRQER